MNCKQGAIEIGEQVISLLNKINKSDFSKPLELYNGASLGQHFRHIIEFYHCIIDGAQKGVIDYSSRKRQLELEQDLDIARRSYKEVSEALGELDERKEIEVLAEFTSTLNRPRVNSSIGRELMFAYDHAIHHLAIIRMGVENSLPEVNFESSLGVAPATLRHKKG